MKVRLGAFWLTRASLGAAKGEHCEEGKRHVHISNEVGPRGGAELSRVAVYRGAVPFDLVHRNARWPGGLAPANAYAETITDALGFWIAS